MGYTCPRCRKDFGENKEQFLKHFREERMCKTNLEFKKSAILKRK